MINNSFSNVETSMFSMCCMAMFTTYNFFFLVYSVRRCTMYVCLRVRTAVCSIWQWQNITHRHNVEHTLTRIGTGSRSAATRSMHVVSFYLFVCVNCRRLCFHDYVRVALEPCKIPIVHLPISFMIGNALVCVSS